jgi:hypothetical protein
LQGICKSLKVNIFFNIQYVVDVIMLKVVACQPLSKKSMNTWPTLVIRVITFGFLANFVYFGSDFFILNAGCDKLIPLKRGSHCQKLC